FLYQAAVLKCWRLTKLDSGIRFDVFGRSHEMFVKIMRVVGGPPHRDVIKGIGFIEATQQQSLYEPGGLELKPRLNALESHVVGFPAVRRACEIVEDVWICHVVARLTTCLLDEQVASKALDRRSQQWMLHGIRPRLGSQSVAD